MRFLRQLPLKHKLVAGTALISCIVLVMGQAVFAFYEQAAMRRGLARDFAVLAEMFGQNVEAGLTFDDTMAVEQTLKTLRTDARVIAARVYDRRGRPVAHFVRDEAGGFEFPALEHGVQRFTADRLETFREIRLGDESVGAVYIGTDLRELRESFWWNLAVMGGLVAAGMLLTVWLAAGLQRFITRPIVDLARAAAAVAANRDYAVRATRETDDEIGGLIDGFNEMLAQIQLRDHALQRAHDELERRVEERTRALGAEVVERRRTEEERDGFFALSLDLMSVASLDGFFRRVNPAFTEVLGYALGELTGKPFLSLVHEDDRDEVGEQVRRLTARGTVVQFETRMLHVDGSYRWIAWLATPRPGRDYFYACGRDVTVLKQAEQQMAREKARLQFIFESVAVGISLKITQADGANTRLINDAHLRICDLKLEQLNEPGIFGRITHPDDAARQAPLAAKLASGEAAGFSMDKRYLRANGEVVWVHYTVQRHAYADGTCEELSTVVDITALKQAEEAAARERARFKFIFDSVPVGICLDESGAEGVRDRLLNDAHLQICGLTRQEAGEGGFRRISHEGDFERQMELRGQLDRGLINRFSLEKRYRRPDGSVIWVNYSLQRRCYPDGTWQDLSTVVDITALKSAQEEVAAERARLKFIFEAVPVGISLVTPGAKLHLVNPAHERITGVSAADSHEEGIFARVSHPDDYRRQMEAAGPFVRGEVDRYSFEKRYLHRDGRVVWAVLTSRIFSDPTTGQNQCVTSLIDITDLRQAQEEITAERARFKFIFDSVPVGISLLIPGDAGEPDTHIVNPAHERVTGIDPARLWEPKIYERASHPDDFERQRPLVDAYKRGEIDRFTIEKRYVHPDGRVVWSSLERRMFLDHAGRKQSITTVVDVTDLKRAQEQMAEQQARFKFIFDLAPIGFAWEVESDLNTRMVNAEMARITGVPAEACRDLDRYRDATHLEDRGRQDELIRRLRGGEIDRYDIEKRYCHADGTVRWAALAVQVFRNRPAAATQQLTTLVDITARKQAEATLAETHRQLLATSRQAGMAEVATGVLHNVGNVLNSVNVSASLIAENVRGSKINRVARLSELLQQQGANLPAFFAEDPRGKQVPTYLQSLAKLLASEQLTLVGETDSLRRNVEHIKSIVAMQQSYAKVSGVPEAVAVVDLVEDAIRMSAAGMGRDDIVLTRDFQARPSVCTEKHKVLQILVNLLRNAKHACEDAGRTEARLTVRITCDTEGARIAVSDNGVGIARENLTRIFAHGFTTKKHGHGFGLHSGALAAREVGGALTVQSDGVGMGATFILTLPLSAEVKAA